MKRKKRSKEDQYDKEGEMKQRSKEKHYDGQRKVEIS